MILQKMNIWKKMDKIIDQVKQMKTLRQQKFVDQLFNRKFQKEKEQNSKDYIEMKEFIDEETQRFKDKWDEEGKKIAELFKFMHTTTEDATQDDNNFVFFLNSDVKYTHFKFDPEKGIESKRKNFNDTYSKDIIRTDGFKVIQTPLSNRIFVIGGNEHPFGTYEFDIENSWFFPEEDDDDMPRIFIPLGIGRSHHSLAATSGLIYWTGGHRKHLTRSDGTTDDEILPRIIEVLKLKDKMWIEYTNMIMIPRYCHSSVIMGKYLYLILGYDANERSHNLCPIERVRIDLQESFWFAGAKTDIGYNVCNDNEEKFFRCFTTVAPIFNECEIICFGYEGLADKWEVPENQERYIKTSDRQTYKQYNLYDNGARYRGISNMLEWEALEEKKYRDEFKNSRIEKFINIDEPKLLEEEYFHNIINYRGMILLPTTNANKDQGRELNENLSLNLNIFLNLISFSRIFSKLLKN